MAKGPTERRPPLVYLKDIIAEIEFLKRTTHDLSFEEYLRAGEKRRAVERSLEIISEASRGILESDQLTHPQIPWRRIRDLGNALRHAYFGVMHERICAFVKDDLDLFEQVIRAIQTQYEPDSE